MFRSVFCCLVSGLVASVAHAQLGMTFDEANSRFPLIPTPRGATSVEEDYTMSSSRAHPNLQDKRVQRRDIVLSSRPGRFGQIAKLTLLFIDGVVAGALPQENGILTNEAILKSLTHRINGKEVSLRWTAVKDFEKVFPPVGKRYNYGVAWPSTTRIGEITTRYSNGNTSSRSLEVNDGINAQFESNLNVYTWTFQVDQTKQYVLWTHHSSTRTDQNSTLRGASRNVTTTSTCMLYPREYFWYAVSSNILSSINTYTSLSKNSGIPNEAWGVFAGNRLAAFYVAYIDRLEPDHDECIALHQVAVNSAEKSHFKPVGMNDVICAHLAFGLKSMSSTPKGQRRMRVLAEIGGIVAVPVLIDIMGSRGEQADTLAVTLLQEIAKKHKLAAPPAPDATVREWREWAESI